MDKTPVVIGAALGAVLSLAAAVGWRYLVPSTETRQLEQAGLDLGEVRSQLQTAELNRVTLGKRLQELQAQQKAAETSAALQQAELERQLRLKTEDLANLQTKTLDAIIGGDSFCYVAISERPGEIGALMFLHQGAAPLYDVTARLFNLDLYEEKRDSLPIGEAFAYASTNLSLGTIATSQALQAGQIPLNSFPKRGFNIFFSARNGFSHELLRLERVDGVWRQALKVIRDEEVIFEKIDPEFPVDSGGHVAWSSNHD